MSDCLDHGLMAGGERSLSPPFTNELDDLAP